MTATKQNKGSSNIKRQALAYATTRSRRELERVVVFEPGSGGHRQVYLKYITEALLASGFEVSVAPHHCGESAWRLVKYARDIKAGWIFIATLDAYFVRTIKIGLLAKVFAVRCTGIYYLFNNLWSGWKSLMWKAALVTSILDRVLVMDPFLTERPLWPIKRRVHQIPDTYDPQDFVPAHQLTARSEIGLPPDVCIFLVFGELSRRKGTDRVIAAFARWDWVTRPDAVLVMAGRSEGDVDEEANELTRIAGDRIIAHNRWISERDVSKYFYAANFLVLPYPRSFEVSSGTMTRSLAAGRPPIISSHGVNGRIVREQGCGITFDVNEPDAVLRAIEAAYDSVTGARARYLEMSARAHDIGATRSLEVFKTAIGRALNDRIITDRFL